MEQAPIWIRTHLVENAIGRRFVQFSVLFLALYVATSLLVAILLAEATLHVVRRPVRHRANFEAIVEENYHSIVQDAIVEAKDGATLKGWYVQPKGWNHSSVILLHGVTDNREGVVGFARMFLSAGYAVLLPDSRAHGESGGAVATYGVRERDDIRRWSAWLQAGYRGCVYLFGESMGAAIALQATEVTPGLCAVAAESSFSTFREIAYDRVSQMTGLGPMFSRTLARPTLELAILYSGLRYGVDLAEADPKAALAASKVPALLIDDQADRNIPVRHSLDIMRTAGQQTQLWEVPGADHGGASNVSREEFQQRVLGWFQAHETSSVSSGSVTLCASPRKKTNRK
jgi:uncharacterized protein